MKDTTKNLLFEYIRQGPTMYEGSHDNTHDDSGSNDDVYHCDLHDNNPNGYLL